jgi:tetratricopeptide (TPR) repeat protein
MATVKQRIGLTDITLEFSRPNANKRDLFGGLVPFGEVWRLGANECTKFTTTSDIVFSDGVLKKGTYAMFAMVNKGNFTLLFNSDYSQWGKSKYDSKKDVLRVPFKLESSNEFNETFSIVFKDLKINRGTMSIQWGKHLVNVRMKVPTMDLAKSNIKEAIKKGEKLELVYSNAAEFYLDHVKSARKAMKYANKSLDVKETVGGLFVKATILKADDKTKEAEKFLKDAISLAKKEGSTSWENYLKNKEAAWEKE